MLLSDLDNDQFSIHFLGGLGVWDFVLLRGGGNSDGIKQTFCMIKTWFSLLLTRIFTKNQTTTIAKRGI